MTTPSPMRRRASLQRQVDDLTAERTKLLEQVGELHAADRSTKDWPQWKVALLSGALAAVAALTVAYFGGWIALTNTRQSIDAETAKESRAVRSKLYTDYLESVDRREAAAAELQKTPLGQTDHLLRRRRGAGAILSEVRRR